MTRAAVRIAIMLALGLALSACARSMMPAGLPPAERAAMAERMLRDITVLASDEFGGRKPGTIGEAHTLAYLADRMREAGLVSGTNDPGSAWRAPVRLVSTMPQSGRVAFTIQRRTAALPADAAIAFTPRRRELAQGGPQTGVAVLFAGSDPAALANAQVAGAIIILRAPGGITQAQAAALFDAGAGAVLVVVDDAAALARIRDAYDDERLQLMGTATNRLIAFASDAAIEGALGKARWRDLVQQAAKPGFAALSLDIGVSIEATSQRREFVSHNLIGKIPGTQPDAGAVLLLAHWDHLGECGPPDAADRICNGAVDNASGVAAMLELAQRLKAGPPLARDIYLLATTAEESGLLGARAFVAAPPIPLDEIVAAFNFDNVAVAPAGAPVGIVGRGRVPFDALLIDHIAKTGRALGNDGFAESFLQRQDGWVLLQNGVPTVLMSSAFASRGVLEPFLGRDYHSPSDGAGQIELGGAIDDVLLHERVIRLLADPARFQPALPASQSAP